MSPPRTPGGTDLGTAGGAALGVASAVAAAGASVCCVGPALGPLIVAWLGVGGAVAIEGLRPYSPLLIALSGGTLAWSFWRMYRPRGRCAPGRAAALVITISSGLLWLSAAIWVVATAAVAYSALNTR
jgi:hypothetical protein